MVSSPVAASVSSSVPKTVLTTTRDPEMVRLLVPYKCAAPRRRARRGRQQPLVSATVTVDDLARGGRRFPSGCRR